MRVLEMDGFAARITKINKKALFTHCMSHRLNLVISKACSFKSVQNMMSTIQQLSWFLNFSETRQLCFERNIEKLTLKAHHVLRMFVELGDRRELKV